MHSDEYRRRPASTDETAAADSYDDEVAMMEELFEFESCGLCDGDLDAHTFVPDPLGHAHMLCKSEQYDDELSPDAARCPQPLFPRSDVASTSSATSSPLAIAVAAATGERDRVVLGLTIRPAAQVANNAGLRHAQPVAAKETVVREAQDPRFADLPRACAARVTDHEFQTGRTQSIP